MGSKRLRFGTPIALIAILTATGCVFIGDSERERSAANCAELLLDGFRSIGETRQERFTGKVQADTAHCRGGDYAVQFRDTPWADWANYWGTGDAASKAPTRVESLFKHLGPNDRGIDGALIDLEYQRVELIKFNLHDPSTYEHYVKGRDGFAGPVLTRWNEMRLPPTDPNFKAVGAEGEQVCSGTLIRHRTLTGICNDIFNPKMGSTGMVFARNMQFEETFPDRGGTLEQRNRHGDRIGLLKPDPQVISRKLLTRDQSRPQLCNEGRGLEGNPADAQCDYQKAPFFNVLAAFWIQFMTHDWFGHLDEGRNASGDMQVGCATQRVNNVETALSDADAKRLGCRKGDRMTSALVAESGTPGTFSHDGRDYLRRPPSTTRNTVTAWWDASQIYGYDETSRKRVKRDPGDPAKLLLRPVANRPGAGEKQGYLPLLTTCAGPQAGAGCQPDPMQPHWQGQEATAFPDNYTIGMSFYHNVFAREHNAFVNEFRRRATGDPNGDSGLRNPDRPRQAISNREVTNDELFEAARLVVAAEIAKIHTIEWTTQLLYGEPL
ncbi:MAG TPA: peroxidase family protein, partial [Burkholderiales bacterium]|nr:peroxidase family protein [Burkholderiales bacterium]